MDLKKKTKIKYLNIPNDKRMIFVSDIHGDVDSLKQGLEKLNFGEDDYLFLIGDIYEKGDETKNLETVRYVRDLAKSNPNVFPMAGNCDEVFRFVLPKDQKDKFLFYANIKRCSVINDIALEQNYPISMSMDVEEFVDMMVEKYADLYEFMDNLDDVIIINDRIVLVHGGIDDIDNIPPYSLPMLKYDRFYEISGPQKKLMIVGHYPTRNYRSDIACVNPIFDLKKKIISIDGGNHIVKGGQVNFVVLKSMTSMNFSFIYVDHYPKHKMTTSVEYQDNMNDVNITFGDNEIEVMDVDLDFLYVRHLSSNTCMWVHNSYVYKDEKTQKFYCYDGSNQFISVKEGDEISIIKKAMPYSVIKKNGYIGLIETKYLDNEV